MRIMRAVVMAFVIIMVIVVVVLFVAVVIVIVMIIVTVVIVVVVLFVAVVIVIVMIIVTVVMGLKQSVFAKLQFNSAFGLQQSRYVSVRCQIADCVLEPWGQILADPKDEIGALQRGCLRRA
jgi:hypothetical protein